MLGGNPKRVPQTGLRLQSVISTFSPNTRFITSCADPARAFARTPQHRCSQQRDTTQRDRKNLAQQRDRKNLAVARAGGKSLCGECACVRPCACADSGSADTLTSEMTARWKSMLKSLRDDAVSRSGERCRMCEGLRDACARTGLCWGPWAAVPSSRRACCVVGCSPGGHQRP